MSYINLRGHQVWSVEYPNNGESLLLLHGGLSSTEEFDYSLLPVIENRFHVYGYDRTAHGRTASREGYYHFDFQAKEAIAYIEDIIKEPSHLIGYSDGGIISLLVALARPDLVKSMILIGTNFHHSGNALPFGDSQEIEISDEDRLWFADHSPDSPEMQEIIIRKAFNVWATEPEISIEDLKSISSPVLVMTGDDEPFTNQHSVELYEAIPNGRLAIIPGAGHAHIKEKPEIGFPIISDFYDHPEFPVTGWPRLRVGEG